VTCYLEIIAIA